MIEPRFAWRFPDPVTASDELIAAGARLGLGARVVGLLAARGVDGRGRVEAFFAEPHRGAFTIPRSCPTPRCSSTGSSAARAAGEKVMVFGDFDADGLTGLAILVRALRLLGSTSCRTSRAGSTRATASRARRSRRRPRPGRR